MTFPILGGNGAVGGYAIDNSLRFNDGDSPTLSRTPASTGNRKTWTFSYWIKRSTISTVQQTFAVGTNASTPWFLNYINSDDTLHIWFHDGTNSYFSTGLNKLRDVSAWYHIMYVVDTTQSTASDRFKVYINGSEMTWNTYAPPAQNFDTQVNTTNAHYIGRAGNGQYFDGYTAETHFIDGQALSPTDFGEFDSDSGIWKPIEYTGTYGTNGFYLDFENSGSLGADQSGNGNNFTPTNLASTDQTTDTPTNNFATLNPLNNPAGSTLSEGNCKATTTVGTGGKVVGTMGASSGKWYCEVKQLSTNNSSIGIVPTSVSNTNALGDLSTEYGYLATSGTKYSGGSASAYGSTYTNGDIIGVALDLDAGTLIFYKNGVSQGTAFTGISGEYTFGFSDTSGSNNITAEINFGNPSFSISSGNTDDNGYGNFEYAPPSGYLALCTQNLATELSPTIDDGSQYFNTVLYTGTGSNLSITGVGFQPDWVWGKCRSHAQTHRLFDSSRGVLKNIISAATNAEATTANSLTSFDSDGFTLGTDDNLNTNLRTFVAWNWKANGGTTSSNTDGSITSTVQANTTAGFSIVTYTGNFTEGATFGHGLGKAPKVVIIKGRTNADNWTVYNGNLSVSKSLYLQTADAERPVSPYNYWNLYWDETDPNSSVVTLGVDSSVNGNGQNFVAYCFAEIEGYSKFGKYTGNGSTDGTFVYTGFRPAFVIFKRTDATAGWLMYDNKRNTFNAVDKYLLPYSSNAEGTFAFGDFTSNGLKIRSSDASFNASGGTYIYMAFAENPFVTSTGIPVTAR